MTIRYVALRLAAFVSVVWVLSFISFIYGSTEPLPLFHLSIELVAQGRYQ